MWFYYPFHSVKDEIRALERYKRWLEREIESIREEIKMVEQRIEELKSYLSKSQEITPSVVQGYGWGRGGGRGMGRGMGMGMGMGRGRMMMRGVQPMQIQNLPPKFRVAVASQTSGGLDDLVSPTFGRCPVFTLVDVENGEIKKVEVIENTHRMGASGVGIAVSQMMANLGVNVVIAGNFGPNAMMALSQLNILTFPAPPTTRVKDAIEMLISQQKG